MSWQTVAVILGVVWMFPVMYIIKWYWSRRASQLS